MKGISKILLGLGVAAVMVVASMPVAEAQCPQAREFGAGGGGGAATRVRVASPAGFTLAPATSLASIWEVPNGGNSGGAHFGETGACPASTYWLATGGMFPGAGKLGVTGFLATPDCAFSGCPADGGSLVTVIEHASDDGSSAGFIAFQVDETPPETRWYDHGRVTGNPVDSGTVTEYPLELFPTVDVTNSSGPVPNTVLTASYADVALNVKSAAGTGDSPLPASATIQSYDIMQATGTSDPGRNRGAYALIQSVPYGDAAVLGDSVPVPCAGPDGDTYVAVGVTYVGGVRSILVGAATPVECDPAIADPGGRDDLRDRKIRPNRPRSLRRSR